MDIINVVLTGKLLAGTDFETAVEKMAALTRLDRSKIGHLLSSGRATIVKKGVSVEIGEQYRAALTAIGVAVELQACPAAPDESRLELDRGPEEALEATGLPVPPPPPPSAFTSQKSESNSTPAVIPTRTEESGSNHASASARSNRRGGNATESSRNIPPIKVPASHGWLWIKNCTELYLEEPQRWTGMILLLGLIMISLSMIPVLGSFVSTVVGPVFAGGLMLGAHGQQQGGSLQISSFFDGFGHSRNQLLRLGAFNLLFGFAIGIVLLVCILVLFKGIPTGKNAAEMFQHLPAILLMGLFVVLLTVPMAMAFWFAPCLVALGDNPAWESMKISYGAMLKNWAAFLVYSLIVLLVIVVLSVLYGLLAGFLSLFFHTKFSQIVVQMTMLVLASPTIALFTLSCYTAYRDVFGLDRQADAVGN